ncbi:MAG: lysophospholipid acyltransferase family protein [Bacteroidaceae bacterium]|nr:lysophospholipid acyltransferase family protein [Bacteroidaceae bacterium]
MKANKINFAKELPLGQKVIYYLLYAIVYVHSLLPLWFLYGLSNLLYLLIYKVVGYRKKLVRKHLADCFPEKDEKERSRIEHAFYHWFCDYIYETIKLTSMSKKQMQCRVTYHNLEYFNKLMKEKRNVVLYLGHYCNWEWVTSIGLHVPEGTMGGQVYHPLENKAFNALMLKVRSSMGPESISMINILRHIIKVRKEGKNCVIGFISDQVPLFPATRYWTDFLNHKDTLVITGTEQIAKSCDFACVYLDISRPKRGYYDINIVPMTETPKAHADWEITEMYFRLFEKTIQRNPEYWLWTHNRWKRTLKDFRVWQEYMKNKK